MQESFRLDQFRSYLESQLNQAYQDQSETQTVVSWLLEHRLQLTKAQMLAYPDSLVTPERVQNLETDLEALKTGKPPQYVIGEVPFLNLSLAVGPGVFIPRPETEALAHQLTQAAKPPGPILDVGGGTGCLAISLAASFPDVPVYALEASVDAMPYLNTNIRNNKVRVTAIHGSIFEVSKRCEWLPESFGLIVSNPPYVKQQESREMAERITAHEPPEALFVPDSDSLLYYRAVARFANTYLCKNGQLAFEVNANHARELADWLRNAVSFSEVTLQADLQGALRYVKARKPS